MRCLCMRAYLCNRCFLLSHITHIENTKTKIMFFFSFILSCFLLFIVELSKKHIQMPATNTLDKSFTCMLLWYTKIKSRHKPRSPKRCFNRFFGGSIAGRNVSTTSNRSSLRLILSVVLCSEDSHIYVRSHPTFSRLSSLLFRLCLSFFYSPESHTTLNYHSNSNSHQRHIQFVLVEL